ncbi:dimethylamine monooxygenase subunit DmmA family protein [Nocardioides ferulae]|uniref:dimethylamine monooxygenase subunit DmmA family protein n=1 Tax=Nocardioides ferulae TaxID=2340821 RepID=UPI0019803652|nr:dimethylamine monooxygenase subunit DmmA family protein [Nocardioides ferulae]
MSAVAASVTREVVPPQVPSLPRWPEAPEPVDSDGTSFLVVAVGGGPAAGDVARAWTDQAEGVGPTTLVVLETIDDKADRASFETVLARTCTGVRVMVVGGQYDVLQVLSLLRRAGALENEVRSFVTDRTEIPVFCAHCQTTFRASTGPGGLTPCPSCRRTLEVHEHLAALRGSFLASDAEATSL